MEDIKNMMLLSLVIGGSLVVGESLGAVAGDDEDVGVEGGQLGLGDGGPAGDAIEGFWLMLVMD